MSGKREWREKGREKQEVGRERVGEGKTKLTVGRSGCVRKKNYEPRTLSWGWVGFHPIWKIPEGDFSDGALVGAGSLKPVRSVCSPAVLLRDPILKIAAVGSTSS